MQEFPIAPGSVRGVWIVVAIVALVMIPAIAVLGASLTGARSSRCEVSPDGLRLRGDLYGRLIPVGALRPQEVRRVDFSVSPELTPRIRTLGTGLPGYQAGWFRLRNGEKALVYMTDRTRAVYVPTTAGYSVLVSPADPEAFVAAVRDLAQRR
jgi:Bacterial PH domain